MEDDLHIRRFGRFKLATNFDPEAGLKAHFITFEPMIGTAPGRPFGLSFALKYGLRSVHIVPPGPDWYQYTDIGDILAEARKYVGPETFTFGSSMGGYAVLHLSDQLGVARGLAFSPLYSIRLGVVPGERRWKAAAKRLDFVLDEDFPTPTTRLWVFYDPHNPDAKHVPFIAKRPGTRFFEVPYGGHSVSDALNQAKSLGPIIEAFANGQEEDTDLLANFDANKEQSPAYLFFHALAVSGAKRIDMLKRAVALAPLNRQLLSKAATLLCEEGEVEDGLALLRKTLIDEDYLDDYMKEYIAMCRKHGAAPGVKPERLAEYDAQEAGTGPQNQTKEDRRAARKAERIRARQALRKQKRAAARKASASEKGAGQETG